MEGSKANLPPLDSPIWKCSLCSNILEDPKTLPCLHSFCAKCVDDQRKKRPGKICQNCEFKDDEGTKVVSDSFLRNVIDYLRIADDQSEENKCSFCQLNNKDTVPTSICITCSDLLCEECSKFHKLTRLTKDHEVKPLKDIHDGKHEQKIRSLQRVACTNENTYLKLYCRECKILACEDCIFKDHLKHDVVKAEVQSKEERENIWATIKPLNDACEKLNSFRTSKKAKLDRTRNLKQELLQKIRFGKEKFIKEVEEQATTAESQVEKLFKDTEEKLADGCSSLDKQYTNLKHKIDRCRLVVNKANDIEFMTLKDILSSVMGSSEIQDHESDDLGEPTVSVTVSDNPGQLFTILEKEVARVRSNVQVPQEDSEEVIKNSSSDSIVYTEIGNCKIPGDRYEPAISDVCWVTDTSFVVADTKNNAAKIFDDKNNFLWKVEAQNVKNVACIDGVVACDSKTHVLLNSEKGCHGKIYFGPFSSNPFELMHGLEVRRIYIAQHGMSTLRVYTKEGKRHGTVQFDTNVSPIYLVQGKEGSINLIDRSSKSVKRVSKTGNLSTLYTHSQDWSPTAMAINNTNEIYIVDSKTSRLLKISESGKFLSSKDLPIENPVGLSISAKGRFIVCKQNGTACVFGD